MDLISSCKSLLCVHYQRKTQSVITRKDERVVNSFGNHIFDNKPDESGYDSKDERVEKEDTRY